MIKDNNYEGCGVLNGFRGSKAIWYICSVKNNLNKPALYNYDKSRDIGFRIQQVSFISSKKEVRFVKGTNESLTQSPFWMHKFGSKDLNPGQNCKFEKNGSGSSYYNLNCHGKVIQHNIQF